MNSSQLPADLDRDRLPNHVAVIMDGNGRWASQRGIPRIAGHRQGAKTLKALLRCCQHWGIGTLTAYAFSTENWRRPAAEVNFLMRLFERMLRQELAEMRRENVQLHFLGNTTELPIALQQLMAEAVDATAGCQGIRFNVAVNYGSRAELSSLMRQLATQAVEGQISPADIQPALIQQYLEAALGSDPDLLIRTSGERRLSNYLLWQLAYTELYFTDILWPDFDQTALYHALRDYQRRDRRFGALPSLPFVTA
ncbi:isoprenyl transferase [filamentous cyanobacterium CCP5]|nr:isoprenyl transferase [filamentous cyanobacterium CCP5]